MTIGDEKVQRYEPRMVGFCDRPPEAGMYVSLHGHYVPQSAYAELAADRDLWRSMATFEGKVSASVLDDLHTTQAQLAELEKHSERIEVAYLASESRAEDAETQLAELRRSLEERCVMLDGLAGVIRQYGLCAWRVRCWCS